MYGTSGNFLVVKMWFLISIHFAWHQVTILEKEREGGGGGWAPMAPPLDPPLHYCMYNMTVYCSSILSKGSWSDRECSRSESLSNTSVTVCECYHLTHFAILLSASPLNLTQEVTLSLEIIGYVGVSISLVAMALTITTFAIIK